MSGGGKPTGADLFGCAGRRALVIGGGSGIGLASAAALLRAGASVFLSGRRADRLEAAAAGLSVPGGVGWAAGDATRQDEVAAVVAAAVARMGGLDTLVVSAGMSDVASVFTTTPERFDRVLAANLDPAWLSVQAAAPHLVESGRGSVVLIGSAYGVIGMAERLAYSTAMALELAPHAVRVNAISPGVIETELFFETLAREADRAAGSSPGRT